MKLKSTLLAEEREQKTQALAAILTVVESSETKSFSDEQTTTFKNLKTEIEELDRKIEFQLSVEDTQKQLAKSARPAVNPTTFATGSGEANEKKKSAERFSFIKAIKAAQTGRLDGLEKEMHDIALKEAELDGRTINGIGIPSFVVKTPLNVGSTTGFGDDMVPTDLSDMIVTPYAPNLLALRSGARLMTGLKGILDISEVTSLGNAAWEGEFDDNAETSTPTDKKTLSPHRLGAFHDFGKQWLTQTSISAENFVRDRLFLAHDIELDRAFWNGSGTNPEPLGLLNASGTNAVALGTNGAVPTFNSLVDMETAIATENADVANMSYFVTPGIRGVLKKAKVDAGSGEFVWDRIGNTPLNGYQAFATTQLPSNLTKGTSNGICHAIVFGDFSQSVIGQWGGFDLVIDPYTRALKTQVRVVLNGWWDFSFLKPKAFAIVKDALLS